jgi:hypothetical protein
MTTGTLDRLTDITELKARVLLFPATLHEARNRAEGAKAALTALRDEFAQAEAEATVFVAGETEDDSPKGKARFSNEAARKAEVIRRLASHPLKAKIAEAESEARSAALDVQRGEDEMRAYHRVVELTVSEVTLIAAGR